MTSHNISTAPHAAAAVHYTLAVIDAAGREVQSLPRRRNLILDQGLNGIAARSWTASFTHAVVGTGTTPTKRDSGAVTFTKSGTDVTASAGFFEAADVGRLLKFDSGEEMYITTFTSATLVTVGTSGALAASEGTVWYVNQTALTTETKRTATYSTDGGANGSTYTAGVWTHKRTFIFSAESGTINYREIGWSHTATAGANLFGRDLLAGVGVTLTAGQQLKVTVELTVAVSPVEPEAWSNPIVGFGGDGSHCIEDCRMSAVTSTGAATGGSEFLEPSQTTKSFSLATHTAALANAAAANRDLFGGTISAIATNGVAYVAGSFERTWSPIWGVTAGNGTAWRSLASGSDPGGGQLRTQYRVLLDANATKDSNHTLTLNFTLSWGRILTN